MSMKSIWYHLVDITLTYKAKSLVIQLNLMMFLMETSQIQIPHPPTIELSTPNQINLGQITIYPLVILLKFKLPTCDMKFDILLT